MRSLVCVGLEMSSRAYCDNGTYSVSKPSGCKVVIERIGGSFVVAFAGSECMTDWVMNALARSCDFNGCEVHTGFAVQFNSVKNEILRYLSGKPKKVICCGHSLGGALANLCALDLASIGHEVQCVTFGSPSVGCDKFHEMFKQKVKESIRVAHFSDPVTWLPVQFKHACSKEIILNHITLRPHSLRSYYNASQKCVQTPVEKSVVKRRCC